MIEILTKTMQDLSLDQRDQLLLGFRDAEGDYIAGIYPALDQDLEYEHYYKLAYDLYEYALATKLGIGDEGWRII